MGQRILLVEDHPDTANVFARMLRRDGYEVSVADSCAQAARMCDEGGFDLLICDINLPDGDGVGVLSAARKTHPETVGSLSVDMMERRSLRGHARWGSPAAF
jgi:two-component system CheB/CheR fusion protein